MNESYKSIKEFVELNKFQGKILLSLGNFDGFHLGHQALINILKDQKSRSVNNQDNKETVILVLTFNPHPKFFFQPDTSNYLLSSSSAKTTLLRDFGVDGVIQLDFNQEMADFNPDDFLNKYIFNSGVKIESIVLGFDFCFGKNRAGDKTKFEKYSEIHKFNFLSMKEFSIEEKRVSSSFIRNLILNGEIDNVKKYLGREYSLDGVVIKCLGRGNKIGFPTANLQIDNSILKPKRGVYFTSTIVDGKHFYSLTNIGINPTFSADNNQLIDIKIETHLLKFSENIYFKNVKIIFHKRIRDEIKFDNVESLKTQILNDISIVKAIIK
jgi:riboflavin kinase/FMN adenylyltransferase